MDDEEFKRIYDTSYETRSPQRKEELEEDKTDETTKEESDDPEYDDMPGVPISFQSRQSKLQDAKEKSKELKWKRKREDELLCKVCGEYGHYSQGCPSTLKPRKAPDLRKRNLMEKIILNDPRLPSRIIGTGGAIVKGIEKETNCRIQIETPKSPSDEPLHVRISGDDPADVESAKQAVLKIIDEWNSQRAHEFSTSAGKHQFMPRNEYTPQREQPNMPQQPLTSRYDQWPGGPTQSYPNLPKVLQQPQHPIIYSAVGGGGGHPADSIQSQPPPQPQSVLPSEVIAIQRRYASMEADEIERHRAAMQKLREDQQKELEDLRGRAANKRAHQSHEFLQNLLVSMQQRETTSNPTGGGGPTSAQWLAWSGSASSHGVDVQGQVARQGLPQSAAAARASHSLGQGTSGPAPAPAAGNAALESLLARLSNYVGGSNPTAGAALPLDPNSSSRLANLPSTYAPYSQYSQYAGTSGYSSGNPSQGQDPSTLSAYGLSSAGQGSVGGAGASVSTGGSNVPVIQSEQYHSSTINSNQYSGFPSSVNANLTSSISLMMPQYPGAINSGQSQYGTGQGAGHSHQQQQFSGSTNTSQSQQAYLSASAINSGQSQPQQAQASACAINSGQSQQSSHQQLSNLLQAFLQSQFR